VGDFGSVLASSASSAHLKGAEMSGSEVFWVKLAGFSMFWQLSVKSADAERVLKAETMKEGAWDPFGVCDSETAHKRALFSCPVRYRVGDELAVVVSLGDWETTSLGVSRLVWTRVASFEHLTMLGERVSGSLFEKIGEISPFLEFSMKLANSERVLRAVTMLVSAGGSVGSCDSKTACNNVLFSYSVPASAGGCGDSGELAVVPSVGGRETTLLEVCRLIWTCDTSFVYSNLLGEGAWGGFRAKKGGFSTF